MGYLRRLSEHLVAFHDTCLIYMLIDGEHGLLIDSGSGSILDHVEQVGVRHIEWVLHTHFHRDQCEGDAALIAQGASLAVPAGEVALFAGADETWGAGRQWHRYDLATEWFAPRASLPVSASLVDYGTFEWRAYTFRVLPAPGHTKGAVALLVEIDGRTVAFTGDVIAAPGRIWSLDALQWTYGGGVGILDGLQPEVQTLCDLRAEAPDLLLPSHGEIMDRPREAIDELIGNLRALVRYQEANANDGTLIARPVGLVPDRHLVQISHHLWMNQYAFANSYALVMDNGNALFLDYGYPTFHHFVGGFRFTEHSIRELTERAGLERVALCIPSHYHDDHIGGVPHLQQQHGTEVWAHEKVVDLLERPDRYGLPCLLPEPIRVDRTLRDSEVFDWEGIRFTIIHTPGHTHYHSALCFEIDGLRVAHSGDTFHAGTVGPILGGPIYQNRFALGDFERATERLRAWGPELLLTGHSGVAEVDDAWLEIAARRAREGGELLRALVTETEVAGFDIDPLWEGRTMADEGSLYEELPVLQHEGAPRDLSHTP